MLQGAIGDQYTTAFSVYWQVFISCSYGLVNRSTFWVQIQLSNSTGTKHMTGFKPMISNIIGHFRVKHSYKLSLI